MTNEPAFVPDYLTLSEAISHLGHKTGRPWDVSALLGFCAQKNIPLHAAVPRNACAVQCEVTDYLPLTIRPVKMKPYTFKGQTYAHYRPATWRMAVAYPITIAHVWQTGRGDVAHGVPNADDHEPEMVLFVNDQREPVTHEVTAADLRVCRETLANILDKYGGGLVHGGMPTMNDPSAVRALLAASEHDGPRDHELCSVAFLAAAVQSHHTKLTDREALSLVSSALCGFRAWAGLAPSQLTVYELGYLDRITPLCRMPVDCHDGGPPLQSEFGDKFRDGADMNKFFVVWADARKAFDLTAPAPAPAAIQSEPSPAPAVDLKPTKKPGDDWTPADYAELLRQYNDLTNIKKEKADYARRLIAEAWGYKPDSIRGFVTKARKLQ